MVFENNFKSYIEFLSWDQKYLESITNGTLMHQVYKLQKEHINT